MQWLVACFNIALFVTHHQLYKAITQKQENLGGPKKFSVVKVIRLTHQDSFMGFQRKMAKWLTLKLRDFTIMPKMAFLGYFVFRLIENWLEILQ